MAVEGTTITDSATMLADSYRQPGKSPRDVAESLVMYESLKACGSGFACGLAGSALLPLSVTADVCSSLFFQMRLCAAVAITGGHCTNDPRVRLLCWGAVAGDICADAISGIATRLLNQAMTLPEAEAALLTSMRDGLRVSYGGLSLKESLLVSLLGGAVSGTAAWLVTRLTGQLAIRLFLPPPAPPCAA
ncbi:MULTISPECIES: hypothetical protein [Enterobacter]|nr:MULTISPECIES: hypothetical protein [Enterobacter]USM07693.2 hypothetical protein B7P19_22660 [Enterobacter sp. Crenshaw]UVH62593.1 hypothetical protein NWV12_17990 [Enterobacter sp. Crenshaw]WBN01225.1 hypothetical protein KHV90_17315 [Enterobacter asburiae]